MIATVLGVQRWTLKNEQGGNIEGITLHYFDSADVNKEVDRKGIFPASITADSELFSCFTSLPNKYDLDIGLRRAGGGKSKPYVKSATIVSDK